MKKGTITTLYDLDYMMTTQGYTSYLDSASVNEFIIDEYPVYYGKNKEVTIQWKPADEISLRHLEDLRNNYEAIYEDLKSFDIEIVNIL